MRLNLFATIAALAMIPAIASAQSAPPAPKADAASAAHCSRPYTTANTLIGALLDDADARAIFSKDIPELAASDQMEMARSMTLKDVQQYAPDKITDAMLAGMDTDLAKLPAC